jgi:hypothetical protein
MRDLLRARRAPANINFKIFFKVMLQKFLEFVQLRDMSSVHQRISLFIATRNVQCTRACGASDILGWELFSFVASLVRMS